MKNQTHIKLLTKFLNISSESLDGFYQKFRKEEKRILNILSKDKSLSINEAFALYVLTNKLEINKISELGVRYGISTRFWNIARPNCKIIGYDLKKIYKRRIKSDPMNFRFVQGDASNLFRTKGSDMVFYDAHPYKLTYDIACKVKDSVKVHCFHDVGKNCFKQSSSKIPRDKRGDFSEKYGWWERHVMAEIFNSGIAESDIVIGDDWRSVIIDDKYGVGISIHNSLVE